MEVRVRVRVTVLSIRCSHSRITPSIVADRVLNDVIFVVVVVAEVEVEVEVQVGCCACYRWP